jgi:hypothetical protein
MTKEARTKKSSLKPASDRRRTKTNRRRSYRAELHIPVTVRWSAGGAVQEETTRTEIVNAQGCLVSLKAPLDVGEQVELVDIGGHKARPGRVVWRGSTRRAARGLVGIALQAPDHKIWGQEYAKFLLWLSLEAG